MCRLRMVGLGGDELTHSSDAMFPCRHQTVTQTNADLILIDQYETIVITKGNTFVNDVSKRVQFSSWNLILTKIIFNPSMDK